MKSFFVEWPYRPCWPLRPPLLTAASTTTWGTKHRQKVMRASGLAPGPMPAVAGAGHIHHH